VLRDLDLRAVAVGAAVAIVLALPPLVVFEVLVAANVIDRESSLAVVFFAAQMVAFACGGFVAAAKRPDAPLSHGACAALAGYLTVQLVAVIVILVRGDAVSLVKIVFSALLSAGLGVLGAMVYARRWSSTA
jgi:putative membrane protein (TIGR04086 family)